MISFVIENGVRPAECLLAARNVAWHYHRLACVSLQVSSRAFASVLSEAIFTDCELGIFLYFCCVGLC